MSEFKHYINSILNNLIIDSKSKKDIEDEIEDHLKLSKLEYMNKGYSEKEAINMAIKSFGEIDSMKERYADTYNFFNKITKILATVVFVLYMLLFIWQSFFSWFSSIGWSSVNIIPLKSISLYLLNSHSFNYNTWFSNVFGMALTFIPFGFLVPILHGKIKKFSAIIIVSAIFSTFVETFQYITKRGVTDIDDIILSVLGSVLGYAVLKIILRLTLLIKRLFSKVKTAES